MTITEAKELVDLYKTTLDYEKAVRYNDVVKIVNQIIEGMQVEIDNLKIEKAKYEAKIYAYEAILQNSNFKMAVVRNKENLEKIN